MLWGVLLGIKNGYLRSKNALKSGAIVNNCASSWHPTIMTHIHTNSIRHFKDEVKYEYKTDRIADDPTDNKFLAWPDP